MIFKFISIYLLLLFILIGCDNPPQTEFCVDNCNYEGEFSCNNSNSSLLVCEKKLDGCLGNRVVKSCNCIVDQCEDNCVGDCKNKACGDDGCGNSCGGCDTNFSCKDFTCVEDSCVGDCENKACGDDGCGVSCGECDADSICKDFSCVDSCEGIECNQGTCNAGVCECDEFVTGEFCDSCMIGYHLKNNSCILNDIIITEFMADPNVADDNKAEWIEIYNGSNEDIDLRGLKIVKNDSSHEVTFLNDNSIINSHKYLLIGRTNGADIKLSNIGATAGFSFTNSGEISLSIKQEDILLDEINYNSTKVGRSWQLDSNSLDSSTNDELSSWCLGTTIISEDNSDLGTPGLVNNSCKWSVIASGGVFSCGIKDQKLFCWGSNWAGQLGVGDRDDRDLPTQVGEANNWKKLSLGKYHSCAINTDNKLYCWGMSNYGMLGVQVVDQSCGTQRFSDSNWILHYCTTPQPVNHNTDWKEISLGKTHTCAIDSNKKLFCWGSNWKREIGILSDRYIDSYTSPAKVNSKDWKAISLGNEYTCAIDSGKKLFCWGFNNDSQLGIGYPPTINNRNCEVWRNTNNILFYYCKVPIKVNNKNWSSIDSNNFHNCAIDTDKKLFCWGRGDSGQLGIGNNQKKHIPTAVGTIKWKKISLGMYHSCGINKEDNLYCWGKNNNGQLGIGDNQNRLIPTFISSDWKDINLGGSKYLTNFYDHSCGIKKDGSLYCWGRNSNGELGIDSTEGENTPRVVY